VAAANINMPTIEAKIIKDITSPRDSVAAELASWREQLTITKAKQMCRGSTQDKYSVAVIATGGLLDTLAAIRAGLLPIWGCDIDQIA
jgi:hypothetical protein